MDTLRHVPNPGLCANCQFKRQIQSDRGSVFYFCERAKTDPNFPKYPGSRFCNARAMTQTQLRQTKNPSPGNRPIVTTFSTAGAV